MGFMTIRLHVFLKSYYSLFSYNAMNEIWNLPLSLNIVRRTINVTSCEIAQFYQALRASWYNAFMSSSVRGWAHTLRYMSGSSCYVRACHLSSTLNLRLCVSSQVNIYNGISSDVSPQYIVHLFLSLQEEMLCIYPTPCSRVYNNRLMMTRWH